MGSTFPGLALVAPVLVKEASGLVSSLQLQQSHVRSYNADGWEFRCLVVYIYCDHGAIFDRWEGGQRRWHRGYLCSHYGLQRPVRKPSVHLYGWNVGVGPTSGT
jgi:hypothetical protein